MEPIVQPDLIVARAIGFVLAITVHSFAIAWMATRLGDPTPERAGRLTLNPTPHFDLLNTIFTAAVIFGLPVLTWGKEVELNPHRLRYGRRGLALVGLAGLAANLVMAIVGAIVLLALTALVRLVPVGEGPLTNLAIFLGLTARQQLIGANILFFTLNWLPLPPFAGYLVLLGLAPAAWLPTLDRVRTYGWILLLLVFLAAGPILNYILGPFGLLARLIVLPIVEMAAALLLGGGR